MAEPLEPPSSDANDRKEWYPVGLQNLQLKRNASGEPIYPQQAVESHTRAWRALYWLRKRVDEIQRQLDAVGTGPIVGPNGSVGSPQPPSVPPGAIIITFQGKVIVLLPGGSFLDNKISGQYQLNLYNFLQSVPGSWELGCIQPSTGIYIWPVVDIDPRPANPIPSDWGPYMVVTGCINRIHAPTYCGSLVIHNDGVCDS